jgi:hypothetical protein
MAFALAAFAGKAVAQDDGESVMWVNHLDFLAGDPSVLVSFNAVNSGVGGGLSGLIVESSTTGENAQGGGNKVVQKALVVPPGFLVDSVRVCYEYDVNDALAPTFISQVRLAQVQDPPAIALVLLDDGTDLLDTGPVCTDSAGPFGDPIDPAAGALLLSLRVSFGDTADRIVVRGVALNLVAAPGSADDKVDELADAVAGHTHAYLTGKGKGHNKLEVHTTPPALP